MTTDPQWEGLIPSDCFRPQACRSLEFRTYASGHIEQSEGTLEASEVVQWLGEKSQTKQWRHDPGTLVAKRSRIILCQSTVNLNRFAVFPFSRSDAQQMIQRIGIPDRFFVAHLVRSRLAAHFALDTGNCWLMHDDHFSVVTIRAENGWTTSLIIVTNFLPYHTTSLIVKRLAAARKTHTCPFLPVAILADEALYRYGRESNSILKHSEDIHQALSFPNQVLESDDVPQNPATALVQLTSKRGALIKLHGDIRAFRTTLSLLTSLHEQYLDQQGSLSCPAPRGPGHKDTDQTRSLLKYLTATSNDVVERVKTTETRLQLIFPVLRLRMAQRDTEIGLQLNQTSTETALAAKQDSSSMKVIAVMTTLFLPGTFIAALLSTPQYNGSSTDSEWRYWVIAAPLTVVVMVGLAAYMWILRARNLVLAERLAEIRDLEADAGAGTEDRLKHS